MRQSVVVAGAMAQRPGIGGHTWVFLQYLLGFRRLGWDVLFLDALAPDLTIDAAGNCCSWETSVNLTYFLNVMRTFDFDDAFSLQCSNPSASIGLERSAVLARLRDAEFLLNVNGFLRDEELLGTASRRVYLDIDPGFGQMWQEAGLYDPFAHHDVFVTVGSNIGKPDCAIPTCGLRWITTAPPVVLGQWPSHPPRPDAAITSIASWRGSLAPVEFRGKRYGLRAHEFRRFARLPRLSGHPCELALRIHPADEKDRRLLVAEGWRLADPGVIAADPWSYREYIQRSLAEFMVAKTMYVETKSGWFSDRSVCFLASGKPVLAQDTGLGDHYPTDEGLLAFSTLEEAVVGVEQIHREYARHARAARALAEEFFNSDTVLPRLVDQIGLSA